jgi:hypothetical protein
MTGLKMSHLTVVALIGSDVTTSLVGDPSARAILAAAMPEIPTTTIAANDFKEVFIILALSFSNGGLTE